MHFINRRQKSYIAVIWFVFLVIVSFIFYTLKQRYNYIFPYSIRCIILLCIVTSELPFIFKIKFSERIRSLISIFYLAFVPVFTFFLLESSINNISVISINARVLNVLILFALVLLFFGFSQNIGFSISLFSIVTYLFYITEYLAVSLRGNPFILSDILSAKTAFAVMGHYDFVLNSRIVCSFYVMALVSSFAFTITDPKIHLRKRLIIICTSLMISAGILSSLLFGTILDNNGIEISSFTPVESAKKNGFPLNLLCAYRDSLIKAPNGYSAKNVKMIIDDQDFSLNPSSESINPNIIVIMNESFTDMNYLETVKMSGDPIAKFRSLDKNCIKGTLISSIYGGNTPNSEFEFLTGCSMAFLPNGSIPYQQLINTPLPSVASHLKNYGYSTHAIHLYDPSYYSRNRVYPLLGFDDFISQNNTSVHIERVNEYYATDRSSFLEIEHVYENNKDNPMFIFCVTVQNHGGYFSSPGTIEVLNTHMEHVNNYASLINVSDNAFNDLIDYFSHTDTPTIIAMYGDHQPSLGDDFYDAIWEGCNYTEDQKRLMKAKVPFVIWANYDIDKKKIEEISINQLGPLVLETAGIPLSGYFSFVSSLRDTLPVISGIGYIDKNGTYFTSKIDSKYKTSLSDYEFLQYNYLKGNTEKDFYR